MNLAKISILLSAVSFVLAFYIISYSERALLFAIPVFCLEFLVVTVLDKMKLE